MTPLPPAPAPSSDLSSNLLDSNPAPNPDPISGSTLSPDSISSSTLHNFYGRDFLITPDVLTPRPETEQLIDLVLSLAGQPYLPGLRPPRRQLSTRPTILDVGTGSGCIAITLALELPHARFFASDVSEPALKIAQKNIDSFAAPVSLVKSDLLRNIDFSSPTSFPEPAIPESSPPAKVHQQITISVPDLVVANLPYVDQNWSWLDRKSLSNDPDIALYAEDNGLALIKKLIKQCYARQIPRLVLESDPCQHQAITDFALSHSYVLDRTMGFALSLHHQTAP